MFFPQFLVFRWARHAVLHQLSSSFTMKKKNYRPLYCHLLVGERVAAFSYCVAERCLIV